jgi:heme-degrading monooxygenase HmoA
MKTFESTGVKSFAAGLLAVIMLTCSFAATAGPAVRVVHFKSLGSEQQQAALKLVDAEIDKAYHGAKGFQWVKYLINTKTFETGSVSLWSSRADVEAFLKSDAYKGIPEKLKPLMKGTMSSEIYEVYEPKK